GGGGGGGGGDQPAPPGSIQYDVGTGDAGTVELTKTEGGDFEGGSTGAASLESDAPTGTASGTASVRSDNVTFSAAAPEKGVVTHQDGLRRADVDVHVAPADAEDPCSPTFRVLSFTATETAADDGTTVIDLSGTTSASLTDASLEAVAADNFVFCIQIVANFAGTVVVSTVDITLTGTPDDPGPVGGDECVSPGGQDDGVIFGDPGTARVVTSTLGHGRHMALAETWPLIYDFDLPIRYCAVISDNFTLLDLGTDTEIDLTDDRLEHVHLTNSSGVVVASRITIRLPDSLQAGRDYELTMDAEGLSIDGEFQENAGTTLAANGMLPSGDEDPYGDFVQIFRGITLTEYLTSTPAAGGMALDTSDRLYIVGEAGAYGPFDAPGEVTEGQRLGAELRTLAPRNILVTNDNTIIVKEQADGGVFEIDPASGLANQIARAGDLGSSPQSSVIAPSGYASVELAGVQPGDIVFADDSGVSVIDRGAETGLKGGLHIVQRSGISNAYLTLWVPPTPAGGQEVIYGAHKPEESGEGFQIHRIMPNGLVDKYVLPAPLPYVEGAGASHLQDVQGRREFLILGVIDLTGVDTAQILPSDFDGAGLFVYDATRDRIQVVAPMPIKTFAFDFAARSQPVLTSDLDRAFISMPTLNAVWNVDGLANSNADGDWPCDDVHDTGIDFGAAGTAEVVASTFGRGRHLLQAAPTVVEFEYNLPLPHCNVNDDAVTMVEADSGSAVAMADGSVRRAQVTTDGIVTGSRVVVTLPADLKAGTNYELTLSGSALGAGSDFVQQFQLVEGGNFLTETRYSPGIAVAADGQVYVANEDDVYGPFSAPAEVTSADSLAAGLLPFISGGGRPITTDAAGNVLVGGRTPDDVVSIDPTTGAVETVASNTTGSFEINLLVAPDGYSGTVANAGDVIYLNSQRGAVVDLGGTGSQTLFSNSVGDEYGNFFVPPADLFGPVIYGGFSPFGTFGVREITGNGDQVEAFTPLDGVDGKGVIRLQNNAAGHAEWLLLADFVQTDSPSLPTAQLRTSTAGLELLVYNSDTNTMQVLGFMSRGVESAPDPLSVNADPDFAFTGDLETVYLTQPIARSVVEFDGFGN
ncbi:MAG: hypothetical protein GY778_03370, partial [bacterium]|nr:hypothetical protein [bacterium]